MNQFLRIFLLVVLGSLTAQAQITQTWSGTVSTDWNTVNNWTPAGIPTPTSDVVIPSGTPGGPIIVTGATAKSVEVQSGASLYIISTGILTINDSKTLSGFTNALFSIGTVTNDGQIIIDITASTSQFGIWNRGTFTNTGRISIDRTTAQALRNPSGTAATFINSGTITVGGSATVIDTGILNQVTFQNNPGGFITIDRATIAGLSNSGTFTNSATLTVGASTSVGGAGISNSGSGTITNGTGGLIQIDRTGSHAIATSGLLNNASVIKIGSLTAIGAQGISNGGTLNNNFGGSITINRTNGGVGGDGVYNGGTLVNSSTLTIGDVAFGGQDNIYNVGTFHNTATGQIRADRAWGNGLWNLGSGTVRNDGQIFIGGLADTGGSGILTTGPSFSNNAGAIIELDRVGQGLVNTASFINAGQLRLGQNAPLRGRGILNGNGSNTTGAVFTNLPGSLIQIDQIPTGDAFTNEGSTTFTNGGTVTVGTSGSLSGKGLTNSGTFTNLPCAIIRVFGVVLNQAGTFTNNGQLTVKTTQSYLTPVVRVNSPAGIAGRYFFGTAQFGPAATGVNLTADAVLVNDGTVNPSQGCNPLINSAQLAGKIALIDRGSCNFSQKVFYAQQAGAIAVVVLNNTAGVQNMGLGAFADQVTIPSVLVSQADGTAIKAALTPGPVNIGINQELPIPIINNGIINYLDGNPIPNVTNNGVIAAPLQICFGMDYAPALQLGSGASNFTVGPLWYTDPSLSAVAGNYVQNTNIFSPTNLTAVNTYALSFTVGDTGNGCVRTVTTSATVSFPVSITSQPAASSVVCEFGSVSVPVGVTGTVLSYQWYKNGSPVPGQTSATLSLPSAQPSDTGTYSLVVTGGCNSTTSTAFSLSVGAAPVVTLLFGSNATVMGLGVPTITVPPVSNTLVFQASGGSFYERSIVIDRINGYEIRGTDANTTGIFPINRLGLFSLTVTGTGGCKRTVQAVLQGQ